MPRQFARKWYQFQGEPQLVSILRGQRPVARVRQRKWEERVTAIGLPPEECGLKSCCVENECISKPKFVIIGRRVNDNKNRSIISEESNRI